MSKMSKVLQLCVCQCTGVDSDSQLDPLARQMGDSEGGGRSKEGESHIGNLTSVFVAVAMRETGDTQVAVTDRLHLNQGGGY